jgi:hypothetical protein
LVALGLSVVTVTGVSVVLAGFKAQMTTWAGQMPLAAVQLAGLAGVWEAAGIIFGAMTACVAYWTLTSATRVLATPA